MQESLLMVLAGALHEWNKLFAPLWNQVPHQNPQLSQHPKLILQIAAFCRKSHHLVIRI